MEYNAARSLCGQRIDTQAEVLATGGFKQGRIDAAADHLLKNFLALGLLDRHGIAQLPIDIKGEAVDLLPGQQWKLQLTFENTAIRIEEHHLHARSRHAADDFGAHVQRLEFNRRTVLADINTYRRWQWPRINCDGLRKKLR